eukprot:6196394-Pleurochrysis_carterae.AAC.2
MLAHVVRGCVQQTLHLLRLELQSRIAVAVEADEPDVHERDVAQLLDAAETLAQTAHLVRHAVRKQHPTSEHVGVYVVAPRTVQLRLGVVEEDIASPQRIRGV